MHHRIMILGNSGSGKSTLAKALARELIIPVFHLDRELLHGNFEKHPIEKRTELHKKLIDQDNWVIDGNYDKLNEPRVQRATLAIFLDVSRFTTLPRVFKRTKRGGQPADTVPDGAALSGLSWVFIKWVATYSRKKRSNDVALLCEKYSVPFIRVPNISTEEQIDLVLRVLSEK